MVSHCRCLLYHQPSSESQPVVYESTTTRLPSLKGEIWSLATHPLFQTTLAQSRTSGENRSKTIVIADINQDLGLQFYPDLKAQLTHWQIRDCLLVPISYQDTWLGMLEIHQPEVYIWSEDDLILVEAIATQAGVALMQAQAYTNLEILNRQLVNLERTQSNLIAIIIIELPHHLPLIQVDGEGLIEVLTKLLDNACKFTDESGQVTIQASLLNSALGNSQKTSMLKITIADTGRGIEPNQLEAIFERFYQEEEFLQRTVGGTGLGLAICRRIIDGLGGKIWAESLGKDQGSKFYFTIPVLVPIA
ncbi:MAG: GAF domain-containing protein [Desmonostoc vinosum HA7617-LM4]|nr:GAF domain-containing protein [Desmonostoc vinosum HA7617-LM4]